METERQLLTVDDNNYFDLLGQILVNSIPKSGYKSYNEIPAELLSIFQQIPFDDILLYLSPYSNLKYSALESIIVQIISNSNSSNIPKPSIKIYLQLIATGFREESLLPLIPKLLSICTESEFMEYEDLIFKKYLIAKPELIIKHISENHKISYYFILSYLCNKYPVIFEKSIFKWNKLAIDKGAIDVIYDYNLKLTNDDIRNINTNYCSMENIELYKTKYKSLWAFTYPKLFNGIQLDDFLCVNNITDADHSKINYAKYLDILNINKDNYSYNYGIPLSKSIHKYHPNLARQFLEYIYVPGNILAHTQIGFDEKLVYIKKKIYTKEYTPRDVSEFINMLFEYMNDNIQIKFLYQIHLTKFHKILEQIELAGISIPWEILISGLSKSYIDRFITWHNAKNYITPEKQFNINIYIQYLRDLKSVDDWTPNIQMEYWKIFNSGSEWMSSRDKDRLIQLLPVEIIKNIPASQIYNLRLYLHDNFGEVIKDNKNGIRNDIALIFKSKINLAFKFRKNKLSTNELENNKKLRDIGNIIIRYYSNDLDILKYFNINGIAEVIYSTNKYYSLSADVLLNLITLTSNQTIIQAYQSEIDRILKKDEADKHLAEFAGLFQIDGDTVCNPIVGNHNTSNSDELTLAIARLANAAYMKPVKYWADDDYQHAYSLKLITPQILSEFKKTQPVPHPDFNWLQLTILMGTDQVIQEYPDLPWQLPIYTKSNCHKLHNSVDWDYIKDRTMLFSHDSDIWTKFSTKLPMEFILERINNYKFNWHSIITRNDFKPSVDQWQEIKSKLRNKDLHLHTNRYDINMIMNNLDLDWDLRLVVSSRTIPLKYLPKILHKSRFNSSLLDDQLQQKSEEKIRAELKNLRIKIILSSLADGLDELKIQCRIANYLFGNRPHIEKLVLGFKTQSLLS